MAVCEKYFFLLSWMVIGSVQPEAAVLHIYMCCQCVAVSLFLRSSFCVTFDKACVLSAKYFFN